MRDRHPVICHRNAPALCPVDPREHISPVEHAGAALDDQIIAAGILREIRSAYNVHRDPFPEPLF